MKAENQSGLTHKIEFTFLKLENILNHGVSEAIPKFSDFTIFGRAQKV